MSLKPLPDPTPPAAVPNAVKNSAANQVKLVDQPFHEWYRFILSFPPHLVHQYIQKFNLQPGQTLLDPFCGTGTTILEAKLNHLLGVGIEANPVAHFASSVKTDWTVCPQGLQAHAIAVAERTAAQAEFEQPVVLRSLPEQSLKLLLTNSIDPLPLHQGLMLLEQINASSSDFTRYEKLAFAKAIVASCSNLHFGPEVGVRRRKEHASVLESWLQAVQTMAADLLAIEPATFPPTQVYHADARALAPLLQTASIDAVFTSPPYPNEKDYTRTTRLETVLLGFIHTLEDLRALKRGLLRSNTRNIYKDDNDHQWIANHKSIDAIAAQIENRRIQLGKTSGFEKKYSRVTKLYFGGMARHFLALKTYLKPGAMLGYVVGDQASFLQVMIPTGQILAEVADSLGYEVVGLDPFRTRLSTATRQHLREEVLVLRWPG